MKTTLILLILLTVFSLHTFAQDFPHIVLEGYAQNVNSLAFSQDGSTLVSGNGAGAMLLWDVNTGELLETFEGHTHGIDSVAFSQDGSILASGSGGGSGSEGGTIYLWDIATRRLKHALELPNPLARGWRITDTSVAFSRDGSILASGIHNKTIFLWISTELFPETFEGHTDDVTSLAFSPDGSILASGSDDDTIRLWNVDLERDTGPVLWDLETGQQVVNTRQEVDNTEQLLKIFEGHEARVNSITFSSDGKTLASGSDDNTVRLWDVATGQLKSILEDSTSEWHRFYTSVAFSPDGSILAGGITKDDTVILWDVTTGIHQQTLRGGGERTSITSVAFSPDGSTLASANGDGIIRLWDLSTRVSIMPSRVELPAIGEQLTIHVSVVAGKNVGGYQVSVGFDPTTLAYVESANRNYLPPNAFVVPPIVSENLRRDPSTWKFVSEPTVTLGATALTGTSNGDGTLATITFEVLDAKESLLLLSDVILTDSAGEQLPHLAFGGMVTKTQIIPEDINSDGVVNILDLVKVAARFGQATEDTADVNRDGIVNIVDLVKIAGAIGGREASPSLHPQVLTMFTAADVKQWLTQAHGLNLTDITSQRGILLLEHLLAALIPKETLLLPNYPNPFNPETWIPYQLAKPGDVTLNIYAIDGTVVRTLVLGHQSAGIYQNKSRAAYWDGRNTFGEPVASGVYFYILTAGEFTATRKMLIRK